MAFSDLTENDKKVYEYIRSNDFESKPWSTSKAAKKLEMKDAEVYEAIANLTKYIKDNIFVHYSDEAVRISAE